MEGLIEKQVEENIKDMEIAEEWETTNKVISMFYTSNVSVYEIAQAVGKDPRYVTDLIKQYEKGIKDNGDRS
jgi:HD-like signal output (HDOD) protein